MLSGIVRVHFPQIAMRLQSCVDTNVANGNIPAEPFGLFWNLSIHAPMGNTKHVVCGPHIKATYGTLLVCAVYIYYYGEGEFSFSYWYACLILYRMYQPG